MSLVRKVILGAGVLLVVTAVLLLLPRVARIQNRIHDRLVSGLRTHVGEESLIGWLHLSLRGLTLRDVVIRPRTGKYRVVIDEVFIEYKLTNLLRYGFDARRLPRSISLSHPRLLLTKPSAGAVSTGLDAGTDLPSSPPSLDSTYTHDLQYFRQIEEITVSNGTIALVDSTSTPTQLAQRIEGSIDSRDWSDAHARLEGSLLGSELRDVTIDGCFDLIEGQLLEVLLELKDVSLAQEAPALLPGYLEFEDGVLSGELRIVNSPAPDDTLNLTGAVEITRGRFGLTGTAISIENATVEASITDWNLTLDRAELEVNGSPVIAIGTIDRLYDPRYNVTFKTRHFDLRKFLQRMAPGMPLGIQGECELLVELLGSYRVPQVRGYLGSPDANLEAVSLHDLVARFAYQDSIVYIDHFGARLLGNELAGSGRIDFRQSMPLLNGGLRMTGTYGGTEPGSKSVFLNQVSSDVNLLVSGTLNDPILTGSLNLTVSRGDANPPLSWQWHVAFQGGGLLAYSQDQGEDTFYGHANVSDLFGEPSYSVALNNLQDLLHITFEPGYVNLIKEYMALDLQVTGKGSRIEVESTGRRRGRGAAARRFDRLLGMQLSADITNLDSLDLVGSVQLYAPSGEDMRAQVVVEKRKRIIRMNTLRVSDVIQGKAEVQTTGGKALRGAITFSEADLGRWARFIRPESESEWSGRVDGLLSLHGTLHRPLVSGNLSLQNATINNIKDYDAELVFSFTDSLFHLSRCDVRLKGDPLLVGQGLYRYDSDRVNFQFAGDRIDAHQIIKTITGDSTVINGNASYVGQLSGRTDSLDIRGEVFMGRGDAFGFHFSDAYLHFENPNFGTDPGERLGITLNDLSIRRSTDNLNLRVAGYLPFTDEEELDLNVVATGNVFGVLEDLGDFFIDTDCDGQLELNLAGTPGEPVFGSGQLRLRNGMMKLKEGTPLVNGIEANVELAPGSRFVHIRDLSGHIGKQWMTIRTLPVDSVVSERSLEPLVVTASGLNLGVITLGTSEDGVRLNIPGLMPPRETGYFETLGRSPEEQFYVAGPLEHPVVRGNINLRGVKIDFPHWDWDEEFDAENTHWVVRLLMALDWDVYASPLHDVRYVYDIPAVWDNVYVNLRIDDDVGGLHFRNVVSDESFNIEGQVESSRGTVEYLDLDFRMDRGGAAWDKSDLFPIIHGRAWTSVTDSSGFPSNIYLTVHMLDEETKEEFQRGRWGKVVFQLSSDNPQIADSRGQILEALGYGPTNIQEKATDALGIGTDNMLFRRFLRPFERKLERAFGLDIVKINSRFAQNFLDMKQRTDVDPRLYIFRSTRLMLGKYLADNLYLMYSGQLTAGTDYRIQQEGMGMHHTLGLEYRVNPQFLLEMELDYDSLLLEDREDKRIRIRRSIPF